MAEVNAEIAQEYLAEQAHVQVNNAAVVHKQMETIRVAMKDLTDQAEVSKRMARKIVLNKAVAAVNQASSRRSVRHYEFKAE